LLSLTATSWPATLPLSGHLRAD